MPWTTIAVHQLPLERRQLLGLRAPLQGSHAGRTSSIERLPHGFRLPERELHAHGPTRYDRLVEQHAGLITIAEAFLTGSTTEVMPVVTVNGRPVGTGVPGPVTRQLSERDLAASVSRPGR